MKIIICQAADGTVPIIVPTQEYLDLGHSFADVAIKDSPVGSTWRIGDTSMLPSSYIFHLAWTDALPGEQVDVDMPKARVIHMDKIREACDKELPKLNEQHAQADDDGDAVKKADIAAKRRALRAVPTTFDLSTATTPEELHAMWPAELPART